jgi:endonuclease/exonuclease/phosphatase family metal-dependent hydrolase
MRQDHCTQCLKRGGVLATACAALILSNAAAAQDVIHVAKSGSPAPTGAPDAPYPTVKAGMFQTSVTPATTVQISAGQYYETIEGTFTEAFACTLTASGGPVTIGKMDYQAASELEIITLNTHLFGDDPGPSWMDYERAEDVADFLSEPDVWPEVVGFQEIWDEDLFWGGDGAEGIWPASGYAYGEHGDEYFGEFMNSGLALMSDYPLSDFVQVEWEECSDFLECQTAKGWLQATIQKDGFSVGVFTLHTEAGDCPTCIWAREQQLIQLRDGINAYRTAHPDHVVFAFGDFNVYGEQDEYYVALVQAIGNEAGGHDADRNAWGFVPGSFDNLTYSDWNPLAVYFDADMVSGRLDYIWYFPSLDGTVEVVPDSVLVRPFTGRMLSDDGLTTDESSDHWSVHGQFKLVRP